MSETQGATWLDLVREYFPDADKPRADYLLWNKTAFPFADAQYVGMQLRALQLMPDGVQRVYDEWSMGGPSVVEMARYLNVTQRSVRDDLRTIKRCLKQARAEVLT